MPLVMIRGLGHRRSCMLKLYFVEHIKIANIFKVCLLKNEYNVVKSNYFKIIALPTSVCFICQINTMHEYTETESKYTGKIGTHTMWKQMYIIV